MTDVAEIDYLTVKKEKKANATQRNQGAPTLPLAPVPNGSSETLSDRLRKAAKIAGSGDALSRLTGIPRRTLESYLSGVIDPKSEKLAIISASTGVNIHWLVTGDTPMLLKDIVPRGALDAPLLQASIEGVEEALRATRREMSPAKKAELVLAIYDLYAGAAAPLDRVRVLHLVKTAVGE